MLLTSLDPAAVAAGHDLADAVRIDGVSLSRSDLVGAGTSVAERVARAQRVAILATPTATTSPTSTMVRLVIRCPFATRRLDPAA